MASLHRLGLAASDPAGPGPLPDHPLYESRTYFRPYETVGNFLFGGDWFGGPFPEEAYRQILETNDAVLIRGNAENDDPRTAGADPFGRLGEFSTPLRADDPFSARLDADAGRI